MTRLALMPAPNERRLERERSKSETELFGKIFWIPSGDEAFLVSKPVMIVGGLVG